MQEVPRCLAIKQQKTAYLQTKTRTTLSVGIPEATFVMQFFLLRSVRMEMVVLQTRVLFAILASTRKTVWDASIYQWNQKGS